MDRGLRSRSVRERLLQGLSIDILSFNLSYVGMQANYGEPAFCRIRDHLPGRVTPGFEPGRGTGGNDLFNAVMGRLAACTDVTDLGHFTPAHRREFRMQIHEELASSCKGSGRSRVQLRVALLVSPLRRNSPFQSAQIHRLCGPGCVVRHSFLWHALPPSAQTRAWGGFAHKFLLRP